MKAKIRRIIFFAASCFFCADLACAEIPLGETNNFIFSISPYLRTDVVTLKNNLYLDNKNKDDSSTYLGIDYSLGFDLKYKENGPEAYLRLERNGPYDYDAPLFIHNTLYTSSAQVERYRNSELFPAVEEFWYDFGLFRLPMRLKTGLFVYTMGNNITVPASYENYGLSIYSEENESFKWHFYYCKPDLANKSFRGPWIKQEREQGIHYTPNQANYFAADALFDFKENTLQPYVHMLFDGSGGKRTNLFSTPTHDELLGTFGLAWNATFLEKLSLAVEAARNFGSAKSSDEAYEDVEHCGYLVYAEAYYDLAKFAPHSRFVYASGNRVSTDEAGDSAFTSGKNRAFSVYSPLNANLADSLYPDPNYLPLVAMGMGNGLNYGINRPTTFGDPQLLENLILFNFGLDYTFNKKLTCALDWWYLLSSERGVGTFEGENIRLSPELGQELDLSFNYAFNKNVSLSLLSGYFFPGRYYKKRRDDTAGSLFSPFLRGDGEADGAFQVELSLELNF